MIKRKIINKILDKTIQKNGIHNCLLKVYGKIDEIVPYNQTPQYMKKYIAEIWKILNNTSKKEDVLKNFEITGTIVSNYEKLFIETLSKPIVGVDYHRKTRIQFGKKLIDNKYKLYHLRNLLTNEIFPKFYDVEDYLIYDQEITENFINRNVNNILKYVFTNYLNEPEKQINYDLKYGKYIVSLFPKAKTIHHKLPYDLFVVPFFKETMDVLIVNNFNNNLINLNNKNIDINKKYRNSNYKIGNMLANSQFIDTNPFDVIRENNKPRKLLFIQLDDWKYGGDEKIFCNFLFNQLIKKKNRGKIFIIGPYQENIKKVFSFTNPIEYENKLIIRNYPRQSKFYGKKKTDVLNTFMNN